METFSKKMSAIPVERLLDMAHVHFEALPLLLGAYNENPNIDDLDAVFGEVCMRLENLQAENTRLRAAVAEMERMLPALEYVQTLGAIWKAVKNKTGLENINAYRKALETAKL